VRSLIVEILVLYSYVLFAYVVLTWIPSQPGTFLHQVKMGLHRVCEPVLGPIRRTIRLGGSIDFSPIIAFFGIQILARIIGG
jgi:YggT family protein